MLFRRRVHDSGKHIDGEGKIKSAVSVPINYRSDNLEVTGLQFFVWFSRAFEPFDLGLQWRVFDFVFVYIELRH